MSTNQFINKWSATNEQNVLEDLIVEAVKFYGIDIEYLPREIKNYDKIYHADTVSEYNSHYPIEVYIKNVDGFTGDGTFLAKFGLEIRDQITLSVSIRRFGEELSTVRDRPQEGDLIYFPLGKRMLQVMFVNHRSVFYQLGHLNVYDLVCETWEYSSEKLNTGIPEVDQLEQDYSQATQVSGDFNSLTDHLPNMDNQAIEDEADTKIDFSENNPFGNL